MMINTLPDNSDDDVVETLAQVAYDIAAHILASGWFRNRITTAAQQARADERERIAQAIEASVLRPDCGPHEANGLRKAARIAREGGTP